MTTPIEKLTCAKMRELLQKANIKGRSSAKTSELMLALCKTHKLIPGEGGEDAEAEEEPAPAAELPFDILREVIKITVYKGIDDLKDSSKIAIYAQYCLI